MSAGQIASLIRSHRFRFANEGELQAGISTLLDRSGVEHKREVILSVGERIDFLVGPVGVEVKIGGGRNEVLRQLARYAELDCISGLVLVTTKANHGGLPERLNGKKVYLASLLGGAF